jgi:hypothetical protein
MRNHSNWRTALTRLLGIVPEVQTALAVDRPVWQAGPRAQQLTACTASNRDVVNAAIGVPFLENDGQSWGGEVALMTQPQCPGGRIRKKWEPSTTARVALATYRTHTHPNNKRKETMHLPSVSMA